MSNLNEFLEQLGAALSTARDTEEAVGRTSHILKKFTAEGLELPARLRKNSQQSYARHLIHCCEQTGCCVVSMVWGPGQGTPVHDHCNTWCVEGCVTGELQITNYELMEELGQDRYRFEQRECINVGPGAVGALIPPFEHHTIRNPFDNNAITVHVYGKELCNCARFLEEGAGVYRKESSPLSYCSRPSPPAGVGQSVQG